MGMRSTGSLVPRLFWPGQSRDDWHAYFDWACERYGRVHPVYGKDHPEYRDPSLDTPGGHGWEAYDSFVLGGSYPKIMDKLVTRSGRPRAVVHDLGLEALASSWNRDPLAMTPNEAPGLWVRPEDYAFACAGFRTLCEKQDKSAAAALPIRSRSGEAWSGGKRIRGLESGVPDFNGGKNTMLFAERMAHYAIEKGVPWITVDANKKVWAVDPDNDWTEPEWAH